MPNVWWSFIVFFFLSGCGGTIVTRQAVMTSPDIAIQGDGFVIEPNEPFDVPFVLPAWRADGLKPKELTGEYKGWLAKGGRRVQIHVKGREQPLYGVITFHRLWKWARGPATRSFSVRLDPKYIDDASDGRIAVVYELATNDDGNHHSFAWVLWLSDRPF